MDNSNFNFDELLSSMGIGGKTGVDSSAVELVALRTENARLKEEIGRLRNTVLRCPCGKKLRLPRTADD